MSVTPGSSTPQNPNDKTPEQPQGSSIDELASRLSEDDGLSEDSAMFLARNWQRAVGFGVVCLLLVWVFGQFRTAEQYKAGEAALKFSEAQALLATVLDASKNQAVSKETLVPLRDTLDVLQQSYKGTSYAVFSPLYLATADYVAGNKDDARDAVAKIAAGAFAGASAAVAAKEIDAEDLVTEIAALMHVKLMMEEAAEGSEGAIRSRLKELVYGTQIVNIDALLSLARLSATAEQRTEVQEIASSLMAKRPDLAQSITQELSRAGISLDS